MCRKEAEQSEDHGYWLSRHTPGLHEELVQVGKCEIFPAVGV